MGELAMTYDRVRASKRKPFNIDEITDVLMGDPINLEIDNILHTPETVVVKLPREEYMKKRIGTIILRKYDVITVCKDDMLIFKADDNA